MVLALTSSRATPSGMRQLGAFDARVDAALRCARLVEQDLHLIHASAHLLATAHRVSRQATSWMLPT